MEKTTTTDRTDVFQVSLEACLEQYRSEDKDQTTGLVLKLPNLLNDLVEQVKERHQEAYQIRRGTWVDGYGKLNKPEIIIRMLIEGLAAIENQLAEIDLDPNNLNNQ